MMSKPLREQRDREIYHNFTKNKMSVEVLSEKYGLGHTSIYNAIKRVIRALEIERQQQEEREKEMSNITSQIVARKLEEQNKMLELLLQKVDNQDKQIASLSKNLALVLQKLSDRGF